MLALVNSKILHWPKVPFFFFLFFFSSQTAACSFQALCTLLFGNFLILFSNERWSNSISLQKSYISTKVVWMSKTWTGWKINLEILFTNEFFMLVWLGMLLLITIFKIFLLIRQETRFISSNRIATRYCLKSKLSWTRKHQPLGSLQIRFIIFRNSQEEWRKHYNAFGVDVTCRLHKGWIERDGRSSHMKSKSWQSNHKMWLFTRIAKKCWITFSGERSPVFLKRRSKEKRDEAMCPALPNSKNTGTKKNS